MMVAIASKVIDFVTEGGYGSKGVMIVSQNLTNWLRLLIVKSSVVSPLSKHKVSTAKPMST